MNISVKQSSGKSLQPDATQLELYPTPTCKEGALHGVSRIYPGRTLSICPDIPVIEIK
jgi:hypothetical protein